MKMQRVLNCATTLGLASAVAACGSPNQLGTPSTSSQTLTTALGRVPFRFGLSARGQAMHVPEVALRQRYKLRILPTLGGSQSLAQGMNDEGVVVGGAYGKSDAVFHAFRWEQGLMSDLGSLQDGPYSVSYTNPNEKGDISGYSNTQTADPNGEDFCLVGTHLICLGFLWKNGTMTALPTLGGNNGQAYQVNSRDMVAGVAENSTPDSTCGSYFELEAKPVVWHNGAVAQLPIPSGDVDGWGYGINDRGQIVGSSGTCFAPTSWPVTAAHALMWPNGPSGSYIDLGNLGSTNWNLPFFISNDGTVVGMSGVSGGYNFHAFLWTKKRGMQDLGTLPGDAQSWVSDINSANEAVGTSFSASGGARAIIWQHGKMTDLNLLAGRHPRFYMAEAFAINDRGWIAGGGTLVKQTNQYRAFVLYPCDDANRLKSKGEDC